MFHLPGGDAYLWAAIDLDADEYIAVYVSTTRSCLDAPRFMKKVKKLCLGRLPRAFVDGGDFYPWAFHRLAFDRYHVVHWVPSRPSNGTSASWIGGTGCSWNVSPTVRR